MILGHAFSILPFWFRFLQSLKRYNESKLTLNLYNAFKFISRMIPVLIIIYFESLDINNKVRKLNGNGFNYFVTANTVSTLWFIAWEYYIDWGLFRSFKKDRFMLRD